MLKPTDSPVPPTFLFKAPIAHVYVVREGRKVDRGAACDKCGEPITFHPHAEPPAPPYELPRPPPWSLFNQPV